MNKLLKRFIAVALTLSLQLSVPLTVKAQDFNNDGVYNYIKSVVDMIKAKYHGEFDDPKVLENMLKGIFSSFDPYTTYYTNEEADEFFTVMDGHVSGIGIQMLQGSTNVIVGKVFPKSPAENVGIIDGDIISKVNDTDVTGYKYTDLADLVRGEKGTEVKLTVIRNGVNKEFTLIRDDVTVPSGTVRVDKGIGYIKLNIFDSNSAKFISEALAYLDSKGISKIILDLKDNPGGEVDQAVDIASNFVPEGVIVSLDFKDPSKEDTVYKSSLKEKKYKLVVLVNENSASASEIVTGAIQDSKAGTIIGTKTFGKAKVQSLLPMLTPEAYEKYKKVVGVDIIDAYDLITKYRIQPFENEIIGWTKITTGRYKTPNGRMIDLEGIEPDIYIQDNKIDAPFDVNELSPLSKDIINNISEKEIVKLKKILFLAGYNINEYSNTWDVSLTNELLKFQNDRSLEATGIVDSTTFDQLNNILDITNLMKNRGYYKAVELLNN